MICEHNEEPFILISFRDSIDCGTYYQNQNGDSIWNDCMRYDNTLLDDGEFNLIYNGILLVDENETGYEGYKIPIDMNKNSIIYELKVNEQISELKLNYELNVSYNDDCSYRISIKDLIIETIYDNYEVVKKFYSIEGNYMEVDEIIIDL